MRKLFYIQACLALIGLWCILLIRGKAFYLDNKGLWGYWFHKNHIDYERLVASSKGLVFTNFKLEKEGVKASAKRLKISRNNGVWQIDIDDGQYCLLGLNLENIAGVIQIGQGAFRGWLIAGSTMLESVHVAFSEFIAIAPFKRLFSKNFGRGFRFHSALLKVAYFGHGKLYYQGDDVIVKEVSVKQVRGEIKLGKIFKHRLMAKYFKQKNVHVQRSAVTFESNGALLGVKNAIACVDFDVDEIKNIHVLCRTPKLFLDKKNCLDFCVSKGGNTGKGRVQVDFGSQDWTLKHFAFSLTPHFLEKKCFGLKDSLHVSCLKKIHGTVQGSLAKARWMFATDAVKLGGIKLKHVFGQGFWNFNYRVAFALNLNHSCKIRGFYHLKSKDFRFTCVGFLDPALTLCVPDLMPDWWPTFVKNFRFDKENPYADFEIFNKNSQTFSFGNARCKQANYNGIPVDDLNVTFADQPGFCCVKINMLKNNKGSGACEVYWPYSTINPDFEAWKFEGNGSFTVPMWQIILKGFLSENTGNSLTLLKTKEPLMANFKGLVASKIAEDKVREIVEVTANIPAVSVKDFPIQDLHFKYVWQPDAIHCSDIQGHLYGEAPLMASFDLLGDKYHIGMRLQNLDTERLLQHPFLKNWQQEIPVNTLEAYKGDLSIDFTGDGDVNQIDALKGYGQIDFKNEHLSQIHLLGPLMKLLPQKMGAFSAITFNQFVANFSMEDSKLVSKDSQLLGPTASANVQGRIDLKRRELAANMQFSFLDHRRLKMPIVRQLIQIFQPVSKGFTASVEGTFQAPKWKLRFNPLQFVIPDSKK